MAGQRSDRPLRVIGHKGADAIVPGNTVESFVAGAEAGSDTIEIDVLWTRDGNPKLPEAERTPLRIAHDWADAAARPHPTLDEALAAFAEPPLDTVEVNLDIKLAGREPEIAAAVRDNGLVERAMVSTMEVEALERLRDLEPGLRRGLTLPRVTKDWTAKRWAKPALYGAMINLRRRLPARVRAEVPRLGLHAVWVFHKLVTPALVDAAHEAGVELITWTVDTPEDIDRVRAMGVDGIVSNDPRLLR